MMTDGIGITVLLSSYNGEKYIEEQIGSILSQSGVNVQLIVRDDGSTDKTREILARLAVENSNLSFIPGENVGVIKSFFELIRHAQSSSPYYALADQDDVWRADKLSHAVSELRKYSSENFLLYCSAVEFVDEHLHHLGNSQRLSLDNIGFKNALVQNVATGCTMVLNDAALSKIASKLPQNCVMHDWWIYLVISAFGVVIYDPEPTMQYRQHNQNVLGVTLSVTNKMKRRMTRILNGNSTRISTQLQEFNQIFGAELSAAHRKIIQIMLLSKENFFLRLRLIFSKVFQRQSFIDGALIRLIMLVGKF
jgi:glycosyltransferase involved in cell wall biosynthesis